MNIEPQMADLPAEKQAAKAIAHTLRRIAEVPQVAYHCGHLTQTYDLLTEAHATLNGITIEAAQDQFPPADQPTFEGNALRPCPFCGSHAVVVEEDVVGFAVSCADCDVSGPTGDDEEEAREAWNKRRPV